MSEVQDAKNWDAFMEQGGSKCEVCDRVKTCFHYCHEHHVAICMEGQCPRDVRAALAVEEGKHGE
jgi:hypothetical protein